MEKYFLQLFLSAVKNVETQAFVDNLYGKSCYHSLVVDQLEIEIEIETLKQMGYIGD